MQRILNQRTRQQMYFLFYFKQKQFFKKNIFIKRILLYRKILLRLNDSVGMNLNTSHTQMSLIADKNIRDKC